MKQYITQFLGKAERAKFKLLKDLKANKLLLNKQNTVADCIKYKTNDENASAKYQISKIFCIGSLRRAVFLYVQQHFSAVAKTESFLHLDFGCVNEILSSSELRVTSEIDVLQTADYWLSVESREMFAKKLLLKIRFPLLANRVLRSISRGSLTKHSSFSKNDECLELIEEILLNKEEFYRNKPRSHYTSRRVVLFDNGKDNIFYDNIFNFIICPVTVILLVVALQVLVPYLRPDDVLCVICIVVLLLVYIIRKMRLM